MNNHMHVLSKECKLLTLVILQILLAYFYHPVMLMLYLVLQQQYICIHQCLLCVLDGTEDEHIYDNVAPANVNIAFEGKEYF